MKILLKLKYDGTDFFGYQVQPSRRTVQGVINTACKDLFGYQCDVTGCSRTDRGVHALSFFACISSQTNYPCQVPIDNIPRALNALLPDDISVIRAYNVADDFHPRYDAIAKEYIYLLYDGESKEPFLKNRALILNRKLSDEQIELMNRAVQILCGEHDFASFMAQGSKVTDTHRIIYNADIKRIEGMFDDKLIMLRIKGNGFLYNMVRIIVGTMLEVAYGKIGIEDVLHLLETHDRSSAGNTVQPHGLYLNKVFYKDPLYQ